MISGGTLNWANWDIGEPNGNLNIFSDEDCVEINLSNKKWQDSSCSRKNPFVCEKKFNTVGPDQICLNILH